MPGFGMYKHRYNPIPFVGITARKAQYNVKPGASDATELLSYQRREMDEMVKDGGVQKDGWLRRLFISSPHALSPYFQDGAEEDMTMGLRREGQTCGRAA